MPQKAIQSLPHLAKDLCPTPLKVGGTYLDTWGRWRHIEGHVHTGHRWPGREQPVDPDRVYCCSCHYDINPGIATDPRVRLVNLPPAEEIAFFEAQLAYISAVNSPDKLKLVQDGLDNMKLRIDVLKEELSRPPANANT